MSKKKGLGQDINKSVDILNELLESLKKVHTIPLKRGLKSNKIVDEDIAKAVNTTMQKAFELSIMVEDLRNHVSGVKPKANARFSSVRVIDKFLSL